MIDTAPVAMIFLPATFTFGIQIATAAFCLGAALAVMPDRVIQSRLGLFDSTLTLRMIVIGTDLWNRAQK